MVQDPAQSVSPGVHFSQGSYTLALGAWRVAKTKGGVSVKSPEFELKYVEKPFQRTPNLTVLSDR